MTRSLRPPPEIIDPDPPPPLCVFCSAPWTDDMLRVSAQCDTSTGYYGETDIDGVRMNLDVHCSSCKRLVYRKEVYQNGAYG